MPHIDEGNLHALLDGALTGDAAGAARAHLQLCANCRARLEEAESIRDQADAILAGALPAPATRPDFEELVARARVVGADSGIWQAMRPQRIAHFTAPASLAWAASLVLALAGGWFAHQLALTAGSNPSVVFVPTEGTTTPPRAPAMPGGGSLARVAPPPAQQTLALGTPATGTPGAGAAPGASEAGFAAAARERQATPSPTPLAATDAEAPAAQAAGALAAAPPAVNAGAPVPSARPAPALGQIVALGYGVQARRTAGAAVAANEAVQAEVGAPAPADVSVKLNPAAPAAKAATAMAQAAATQPATAAPAERAPARAREAQPSPTSVMYTGDSDVRDLLGRSVGWAPTYTPYTVAPELLNRLDVERALAREYPARAGEEGRGGTTFVWLLVDTAGGVRRALVKTGSGDPSIDGAALRVARLMRFSPALNVDRPTPVWVQLPIIFRPDSTTAVVPPRRIQPQPPAPRRTDVSNPAKPH